MIPYPTRKDNEKKKKKRKRQRINNKVYEEADEHSRQKSRRAVNKYEVIFGSIGFGWHLANGEWRKYVSLYTSTNVNVKVSRPRLSELMEKTNYYFYCLLVEPNWWS